MGVELYKVSHFYPDESRVGSSERYIDLVGRPYLIVHSSKILIQKGLRRLVVIQVQQSLLVPWEQAMHESHAKARIDIPVGDEHSP